MNMLQFVVWLVLLGIIESGRSQITCVSSCEEVSLETMVTDSISDCCSDTMAGGFLQGDSRVCSSCTPFRVVDPRIDFTFDPEIPEIGDQFTATCSVSISPDVTGNIQVQWRNERGEVITTGDGNNTAEISFTIDSFTPNDGNIIGGFNCQAVVIATDDDNNMRSYTIELERNILFTSTTTSTSSITSSGDFTEGSKFQLTCTVMGAGREPGITWLGPHDTLVSNSTGVEVGEVMGVTGTYSRSIKFKSLAVRDTGRYRCMNTVTNPPTIEHTVFLANRSIVTTSPVVLGRPFTAQCTVTVTAPSSLSATVETVLENGNGTRLASDVGINSAEAVFIISQLGELLLGEYRCRATVFSELLDTPVVAEQSFPIEIVEQCETSPGRCAGVRDSECIDSNEGPVCQCRPGFLRIMRICMNMNECRMSLDDCPENSECFDTRGGFLCTCQSGFTGNGTTCTDIDECTESIPVCGSDQICVNTAGSFICRDDPDDVTEPPPPSPQRNECESESPPCHVNALCTDTPESFNCSCMEGYYGDGSTCIDIDECQTEKDECDDNAICINNQGAYFCRCVNGYYGTGFTCKKDEDPTTEGPTVEDPTTEGPTSEGPTTDDPTTEGPTSESPTVEDPTTEGPTTEGPTTEGPTTEGPTVEDPISEDPSVEAPTVPTCIMDDSRSYSHTHSSRGHTRTTSRSSRSSHTHRPRSHTHSSRGHSRTTSRSSRSSHTHHSRSHTHTSRSSSGSTTYSSNSRTTGTSVIETSQTPCITVPYDGSSPSDSDTITVVTTRRRAKSKSSRDDDSTTSRSPSTKRSRHRGGRRKGRKRRRQEKRNSKMTGTESWSKSHGKSRKRSSRRHRKRKN